MTSMASFEEIGGGLRTGRVELGDVAQRVRLASSPTSLAGLLCVLADDPEVMVRAAVALNRGAPDAADDRLARDPDGHVRALLGRRLAALCPDAGGHEQVALSERVTAMLQRLVRDEVTRVRLAVAEVLRDMAGAPREVILALARDADLSVSDPVVQMSPVLTAEDLLALLAASPATAVAIAGRSGLDPVVCDAVVTRANDAAIVRLLENGSAEIREATLDRLVARSAARVDWHQPLVQRPALSARSAAALANIVSLQLLGTLAARNDLAPALLADVRERLAARLADGGGPPAPPVWPEEDPDEATARRLAERLRSFGRLNDEALAHSARLAQKRMMAALLAVAGALPDRAVKKAISLRSAKGLISLVWLGAFSPRHNRAVQVLLCQIPPAAALVGPDAESFPLSVDEMSWQIGFLVGDNEG